MVAVPSNSGSPSLPAGQEQTKLVLERWRLVRQLAVMLDRPMTVLAFVWLTLLVVDFVQGLHGYLAVLNWVIWGLFVVHFGLEFFIAPDKLRYLRRNWPTAIALVLPAFRLLRFLRFFRALQAVRAAQATRTLGMLRLATSMNRGIRALRRTLQWHGAGYVAVTTLLVIVVGAAGIYWFERPAALREAGYASLADSDLALNSYGEALWWTAMLSTTMGPQYWPKTVEGRVLMWVIAVYSFAVFGYLTATLASYFVGRKQDALEPLRSELAALRAEIRELRTPTPPLSEGQKPAPESMIRVDDS